MKAQNLKTLLQQLKDDNLFYELHNRDEVDDCLDTSHYMIVCDKQNLYKSAVTGQERKKYLYINMNIDNELNLTNMQLIINYKDENHSFIDLAHTNEIIHLAYEFFR